MCRHTDITFTWNPPEYSGKASVIVYTLNVSNSIYTSTEAELSLRGTLLNGVSYQAHLTASNCIGESSPVYIHLSISKCCGVRL